MNLKNIESVTPQNQWRISHNNRKCYFCRSPAVITAISAFVDNFKCSICGQYCLALNTGLTNGLQESPYTTNRQKVSYLLAERHFRETQSLISFSPQDCELPSGVPTPALEVVSVEDFAKQYPIDEKEIPGRILESLKIYKKNRGIPYGEEIKVDLHIASTRVLTSPLPNTRWAFCETVEAFERILRALKQRNQLEYRFDKEAVYIDLTPYTVAKEQMEQKTINKTININVGTNEGLINGDVCNSKVTYIAGGVGDAEFAELLEKVKASAASFPEAERKEVANALAVVQDYRNGGCDKNAFDFAVKTLKAIKGGVEFAANVATLLSCFGVVAAL